MLLPLLLAANIIILNRTREPPELVEVRRRYRVLRDHLRSTNNLRFQMLWDAKPLTAFRTLKDTVGYNTNKGANITLCLQGTANEIFHVLIHELAHCTVEVYDHSDLFWSNYKELRDICVSLGIYERIEGPTEFCGEHISD
ncbi:hypothetical protein DSLPV1_078 [Dishui lake phycodnavirus 1]|uniref:hypothetical protein n=1 Tax=Dishui lake phycodnavirus 1 TaxID=2079134 RepID=UPI000CD6C477|nr:hypothetical protein C5Y57_gp078 [Dishui lake phycodnavirus 1]AUT19049.1 hypothetical protein DSLPV1_078 [Dishui lake phycodnavirus 1]